MEFSPLFWPVTLRGKSIAVLDETALPRKLSYIKVSTPREACRVIRQMKTRAVGQVLLVMYTFLMVARRHRGRQLLGRIQKTARLLNATRPTLPFKMLTGMVSEWAAAEVGLEEAIGGFLEGLKKARIEQAKQAAFTLRDKDVILTHCNVSGLMPLIAAFCREADKKIPFFVTQTPPYLQGMRLSAWELQRAGCEVTVIADNMVAQVMAEGKINKVLVGADNLARNGDIANKVGTYQIAVLARYFKIPFYVLCPPPSGVESGRQIPIEVRPDKELLGFAGASAVPRGVRGYYPAFDVTPRQLITKHIYLELPGEAGKRHG